MIAKLNIDHNPMTASQYQIMSPPTMTIFKEGQEVNKLHGAMQKGEIENYLRQVV